MRVKTTTRLAVIKLAAMGDVALACRVLRDFSVGLDSPLEVQWTIDRGLVEFASALWEYRGPPAGVSIAWNGVDSRRIFAGSLVEKAKASIELAKGVHEFRPDAIAILHRDWRYRALLQPIALRTSCRLSRVARKRRSELDAYTDALREAAPTLWRRKSAPVFPAIRGAGNVTNRIGVFVGGGRNQKTDFDEKRWPHFRALVSLLLERTDCKVVVLGGPDDAEAAADALRGAALPDRVENLAGKVPVPRLPETLARLDAFLSIDTGMAHVAAMVMGEPHQRVVTLFGPTDTAVWAPRQSGHGSVTVLRDGLSCSPCYRDDGLFKRCRFTGEDYRRCMNGLSAERVLEALMPRATR